MSAPRTLRQIEDLALAGDRVVVKASTLNTPPDLFAVDLKSGADGPMVIEINDNPNLEHGVEDEADRNVWNRLTEWFVKRLSR